MWTSFVTVLVTAVRAGFFLGSIRVLSGRCLWHSLLCILPVKALGDVRVFLGRSLCLGRRDRVGTTQC